MSAPNGLIFSPDAIAREVHSTLDSALAAIPTDRDGVVLVDATKTSDGKPVVEAVLATRIGKNWSVGGGVTWDGDHVAGKVAVAGSWQWHK